MAKRILIADDSVTIQRAFAMVFTGQDVAVVAARSLDDALMAARRDKPDVVVADVALGNRSGYDLCNAIKSDGALRGTAVLILGSSQNPVDEQKARQVGSDGALTKPFDSQTIIDRVQETLARGPTAAATAPSRPSSTAVPQAVPPAQDTTNRVDDADIEEEYGEFTLEHAQAPAPKPVAPMARPASVPVRPAPAPAAQPRPSLIPGVNPSAVPARRPDARPAPAAAPVRPQPMAAIPIGADAGRGAPMSRTLMGMPAAGNVQARGGVGSSPAPARPQPSPGSNPTGPGASEPRPFDLDQKVADKLDAKLAQVAARGPEYEAIAKLSREIIEQVVWEVVPELAEVIIRQEVDRLASAKSRTT